MFDWPHTTEAIACKICRETTNHVAAQHRHPSRPIGQASPHQSQSEHSQCHRQKETVWEAFYPPPELLFGRSSMVNQPLRLKRSQSETWQTYEEMKLVLTWTVPFFHPENSTVSSFTEMYENVENKKREFVQLIRVCCTLCMRDNREILFLKPQPSLCFTLPDLRGTTCAVRRQPFDFIS